MLMVLLLLLRVMNISLRHGIITMNIFNNMNYDLILLLEQLKHHRKLDELLDFFFSSGA